ncbi:MULTISPECIES: hypothetical protein [Bradyrhizobium]|uniref:hypothetical protein n=1 Tax=Bradyrhizobium TaxID=374 RepID=UPI00054F8415|nr:MULTISPECIES: hypothetical protein [unclassified Bradyrhizobium]MDA9422182.1 hypothetical protein [Bradyrhizobium sp. CCBAU 53380]
MPLLLPSVTGSVYAASCEQGAAARMFGALQDDEVTLHRRRAKIVLRLRPLRVEPDHQHGAGPEQAVEPIHRRIDGA